MLLYRRRTKDGDMTMGEAPLSGLSAMTEVIKTRIGELMGGWWEDGGGAPDLFNYLSGPVNDETRGQIELLIIDQILSTLGVTGVSDIRSAYLVDRSFQVSLSVATEYGNFTAEATL